ncbi:hypothetical protein PENTCL1PPCAC_3420, partial [Pristionchus entomophagus]
IYRSILLLATFSALAEGICYDLLNPSTGTSDCSSLSYLCSNSVYYTLMTTQCPATCGRCNTTTTTTTTTSTNISDCTDLTNPSTGVSDCSARASLCNNTVYYSLMTTQCPRTCGRCNSTTTTTSTSTNSTCADLTNPATGVSDCSSRAYLCNNSVYYSFMTTQCPSTCGRCSTSTTTTTTNSTCVDLTNPSTGVSDCSAQRALCTNSAYISLMRVQCPATCGFCSTGK